MRLARSHICSRIVQQCRIMAWEDCPVKVVDNFGVDLFQKRQMSDESCSVSSHCAFSFISCCFSTAIFQSLLRLNKNSQWESLSWRRRSLWFRSPCLSWLNSIWVPEILRHGFSSFLFVPLPFSKAVQRIVDFCSGNIEALVADYYSCPEIFFLFDYCGECPSSWLNSQSFRFYIFTLSKFNSQFTGCISYWTMFYFRICINLW